MSNERSQIILELVKSLNQGNTCYAQDRVKLAIQQYNELVEKEIIPGQKVRIYDT